MSRAIKDSLKKMKTWVFQSQSRVNRIAAGNGTAGTRAAPTQSGTNDHSIGLRLDNGETFLKDGKEHKRYKLQINKNANNKTLKELANKNSHRVYAEADVPLGAGNKEDVVEKFFEDLEENIKV